MVLQFQSTIDIMAMYFKELRVEKAVVYVKHISKNAYRAW